MIDNQEDVARRKQRGVCGCQHLSMSILTEKQNQSEKKMGGMKPGLLSQHTLQNADELPPSEYPNTNSLEQVKLQHNKYTKEACK